jgi:superfamily I DNA/RNA helicase
VSTLHNSKGHEFRAVFILGLAEGSIPYVTSQEPEEMEREAALFYVAMTRAKELLYLSYACKTANDKKTYPSRFLSDLGNAIDTLDFVKLQR